MDSSRDQGAGMFQFKVSSVFSELGDRIPIGVSISQEDTLLDVRAKLMNDYEHMPVLPDEPWFFYEGNVLISDKQEGLKRAWHLRDESHQIIVAPLPQPKRSKREPVVEEGAMQMFLDPKQGRIDDVCQSNVQNTSPTAFANGVARIPALGIKDEGTSYRSSTRIEASVVQSSDASLLPVVTPPTKENFSPPRTFQSIRDTTNGTTHETPIELERDHNNELYRCGGLSPISCMDFQFPSSAKNPHQAIEEALRDSAEALDQAKALLDVEDNKHFCTTLEHFGLSCEIQTMLDKINKSNGPRTTIAVLGRTGE
jgi:hypothetical protein